MDLRKLLNLPIIRSALSTLILIIPMVYDVYGNISFEIKIALILLVILINIILISQEIKRPTIKIEEMLESLIKLICSSNGNDLGKYRANIMLKKQKSDVLYMKYHHNMMGANDRGLEVNINSSCCGDAFNLKQPIMVDLEENPTAGYTSDVTKVSESMKSILSVPIHDISGKDCIGALNVDCKLSIDESGFLEPGTSETANIFSYIISNLL